MDKLWITFKNLWISTFVFHCLKIIPKNIHKLSTYLSTGNSESPCGLRPLIHIIHSPYYYYF
nr:MAG TPA: Thrombin Light Chain [Caudoviricetes sp.]